MNNPAATFALWRTELVAEHAAAELELAEAAEILEATEASLLRAKADWGQLQAFATGFLHEDESLATAIARRLNEARETQVAAGRSRAAASGRVDVAKAQIASLREAVAQLDRALSGKRVVALPTIAAQPRRIRPLVDFDTIEAGTR